MRTAFYEKNLHIVSNYLHNLTGFISNLKHERTNLFYVNIIINAERGSTFFLVLQERYRKVYCITGTTDKTESYAGGEETCFSISLVAENRSKLMSYFCRNKAIACIFRISTIIRCSAPGCWTWSIPNPLWHNWKNLRFQTAVHRIHQHFTNLDSNVSLW